MYLWETAIVPTDHGSGLLKSAGIQPNDEVSKADIALAMFRAFFHHDFLIDPAKSDWDLIEEQLNKEMVTRQILLPHRVGRLLYDKFNDTCTDDRTDHLLAAETLKLLDGTPQGVHQVGKLISGPLGFLTARQARYIPPSLSLYLWHCSDPGCGSLHAVELHSPKVPVVRLAQQIGRVASETLGPASEWSHALHGIVAEEKERRSFTYYDVSYLVGHAVVGKERQALVESALAGEQGELLRTIIGSPPRKKSRATGSAAAVARGLTEEEQLQLLYVLTDPELTRLIDTAVKSQSVYVPATEVRKSSSSPPRFFSTAVSELSSLGLRCVGSEPVITLSALVWDAYSKENLTGELDWRLRKRSGASTRNALLEFLSKTDPTVAVKELIIPSEPITKFACERTACTMNGLDDDSFVDRLLWKMGFDIPRFASRYGVLARRLESFSHTVLSVGSLRTEHDREIVRSAGVNLFVSIEEYLEHLIAYNAWLLASDHFLRQSSFMSLKPRVQKLPPSLALPSAKPTQRSDGALRARIHWVH